MKEEFTPEVVESMLEALAHMHVTEQRHGAHFVSHTPSQRYREAAASMGEDVLRRFEHCVNLWL